MKKLNEIVYEQLVYNEENGLDDNNNPLNDFDVPYDLDDENLSDYNNFNDYDPFDELDNSEQTWDATNIDNFIEDDLDEPILTDLTEAVLNVFDNYGKHRAKIDSKNSQQLEKALIFMGRNPGAHMLSENLKQIKERAIPVPGIFQMVGNTGMPFGEPFSGRDVERMNSALEYISKRRGAKLVSLQESRKRTDIRQEMLDCIKNYLPIKDKEKIIKRIDQCIAEEFDNYTTDFEFLYDIYDAVPKSLIKDLMNILRKPLGESNTITKSIADRINIVLSFTDSDQLGGETYDIIYQIVDNMLYHNLSLFEAINILVEKLNLDEHDEENVYSILRHLNESSYNKVISEVTAELAVLFLNDEDDCYSEDYDEMFEIIEALYNEKISIQKAFDLIIDRFYIDEYHVDSDEDAILFDILEKVKMNHNLREGGHRVNIDYEGIAHQICLIKDATKRQEAVDKLFNLIKDKNTEAAAKEASKVQKAAQQTANAAGEIEQKLTEGRVKSMLFDYIEDNLYKDFVKEFGDFRGAFPSDTQMARKLGYSDEWEYAACKMEENKLTESYNEIDVSIYPMQKSQVKEFLINGVWKPNKVTFIVFRLENDTTIACCTHSNGENFIDNKIYKLFHDQTRRKIGYGYVIDKISGSDIIPFMKKFDKVATFK